MTDFYATDLPWPDGWGVSTLRNNLFALQHTSVTLQFNRRTRRILIGEQGGFNVLTDAYLAHLRQQFLDRYDYDPGASKLLDAIRHLAYSHSHDPLLAWLRELSWDGAKRAHRLFSYYFGAEDTELNRVVAKITLVAAVRRALRPGCRFDLVPFLVSQQGAGKSRAIRILAMRDEWFSDNELLHLAPREQVEMMLGVWLYELAERGGLHQTSAERYKAIISRRQDRARAAYARTVEDIPRSCIFIGTTNDAQFLRDATGNRRFLPIAVTKIRLAELQRDAEQLWAEAVRLEAAGFSITLPPRLRPAAAELQADALEIDPWSDSLSNLSGEIRGDEERVTNAQILAHLGIGKSGQSPAQLTRATNCALRLGWRRSVFKFQGRTVRGLVRRRIANERERSDKS